MIAASSSASRVAVAYVVTTRSAAATAACSAAPCGRPGPCSASTRSSGANRSRLPLPRADQRHRAQQQGGRGAAAARSCDLQREQLDGLAEAHVVGEAGAQPQLGEERQPRQAPLLVGAQLRAEARGGGDRRDRPIGPARQQVAEEAAARAPAVTGSGTSSSAAQSSGWRPASASTSPTVGGRRGALRRRNASPARSFSASTLTHRPRTRTSCAFAATSSASSSSPSSSSPTATDQRKSASSSRPRPLRVSTRSAGVLRAESVSPTRREPSHPRGSCTPNPASASSGASTVRNWWAPPFSRSSASGRAARRAGARSGITRAARPSSASSSSCGSARRRAARPSQTCAAGTSRLGSAVDWRKNSRIQWVPSPVWSSGSSPGSAGSCSVRTSESRKLAAPRARRARADGIPLAQRFGELRQLALARLDSRRRAR